MAKKKAAAVPPEWSHMVDVSELEAEGLALHIAPDVKERAELAMRLGLVSLDRLECDLKIMRAAGSMTIHVTGRFEAEITQNCVVSMEPVVTRLAEDFEGWFSDDAGAVSLAKAKQKKLLEKGHVEMEVMEEKDDPEAVVDGQIDVGELTVQHLSLNIDPYPHAEGVAYEIGDDDEDVKKGGMAFKNPFAALKEWKDKL